MKNFDPDNQIILKQMISHEKFTLVYHIVSEMIKDLKYVKNYSVNPLYLFFNKVNEHFEEINGKQNLTPAPFNKSKKIIIRSE